MVCNYCKNKIGKGTFCSYCEEKIKNKEINDETIKQNYSKEELEILLEKENQIYNTGSNGYHQGPNIKKDIEKKQVCEDLEIEEEYYFEEEMLENEDKEIKKTLIDSIKSKLKDNQSFFKELLVNPYDIKKENLSFKFSMTLCVISILLMSIFRTIAATRYTVFFGLFVSTFVASILFYFIIMITVYLIFGIGLKDKITIKEILNVFSGILIFSLVFNIVSAIGGILELPLLHSLGYGGVKIAFISIIFTNLMKESKNKTAVFYLLFPMIYFISYLTTVIGQRIFVLLY
ncbi:MAG: hypothetical protein ACRC57_04145 [Sarcina sp.]